MFYGESYAVQTQKEAGPKVEAVKATSLKRKTDTRPTPKSKRNLCLLHAHSGGLQIPPTPKW